MGIALQISLEFGGNLLPWTGASGGSVASGGAAGRRRHAARLRVRRLTLAPAASLENDETEDMGELPEEAHFRAMEQMEKVLGGGAGCQEDA